MEEEAKGEEDEEVDELNIVNLSNYLKVVMSILNERVLLNPESVFNLSLLCRFVPDL